MYIIVGLGNPGNKYDNTRHNIGFALIDAIAHTYNISVIENKHRALIGKGMINGVKVILVKPLTYMNVSGESVRSVVDYYKIDETSQLIILYDDISLEVGQLRIREKGSAGGHNGIKSIIEHLGDNVFLRMKIGVGNKPKGYDLADYVLGHFTEEEIRILQQQLEGMIHGVDLIVHDKVAIAMNLYNKKIENK
ncbi:MAG: aminoacyl-tRNA hydrolase [Eubacteriales bacterium]